MPNKKTKKATTKQIQVSKETASLLPQMPTVVPVSPPMKTEAEKIWNEIKDLSIQMFGLPDQLVSHHCKPVQVEPTKLYVIINSSAVLPSLETAVAPKFTVELVDKYVIVARVPKYPASSK